MKNPYEVLGLKDGASIEEIKQAYKEMVKKYHPDRYSDNPLRELAEEKMREINEAYEYLSKNSSSNGGYSGSYNDTYNNNNIRDYINRNDLASAERELNKSKTKNAEWFYLRGIINMKRGWYTGAVNDIQTAVNMDPSNYEYRNTLNNILNMNNSYKEPYRNVNNKSNDDICNICTWLCIADQCCECMGGDLIGCC